VDLGNPGGGCRTKWNNSTSKASKVRSHWGGVDLKGGVELSIQLGAVLSLQFSTGPSKLFEFPPERVVSVTPSVAALLTVCGRGETVSGGV